MAYQRILLGISGGIAAYKAAELVRLLRKQSKEVKVVMTQAACAFITPLTLQALSGNAVHCELLDTAAEQSMSHIALARWADVLVIAPATAHTLAKCRYGLADDLLSTLYLAANCPVYVAPAMNHVMWHKAAIQDTLQALRASGVLIIDPETGYQACGEHGAGRMAEPATICAKLLQQDKGLYLQDTRLLISAGPTREPLDPVRYLTNRSSGKMGYALAIAAVQAGADVTLVSGPVALVCPAGVRCLKVETAAEMHQAVLAEAPQHAIYIGAAAVADYRPTQCATDKLKKAANQLTITLEKTADILADVAALASQRPFTVGFAAETDHLERYARGKLVAKNLDMIAANWVGQATGGFDSEQNALQVYWRDGQRDLAMTDKIQLAMQLLQLIAEQYHTTYFPSNEKYTTENS
jgi:phosphopantothenoylcysteine decarboxylase/phosphopantothenate--cysteine ligase